MHSSLLSLLCENSIITRIYHKCFLFYSVVKLFKHFCTIIEVKILFDSTLTIVGALISFIVFYKLEGVREGTIAAAIIVGMIVRWFKRNWTNIDEIIVKLVGNNNVYE